MRGERLRRVEDKLRTDPKLGKLFLKEKIQDVEFFDGTSFSQYYEFVQIMGAGSFGLVFSARDKKTKELCSIKLLSKKEMGTVDFETMRKETSILKELKHPKVLRLIGVI